MRYVDLRVRPDDRWFHPIYRRVSEATDLRPGPIHNVNRLDDGTIVLLYEVTGPEERVDAILDEYGTGMKRDTTRAGRSTLVWAHLDPEDETTASVVSDLLDVADTYSVVVDTPIEVTAAGELELTLVGESGVIRELYAEAPERAQVTVEKTGTYRPENDRLFSSLTPRQQEVLLAAVETGYYDGPRRATYGDVADRVDCSATTVGEHLRKIERRLVREIVPEDLPPAAPRQ